MEPRPAVRRRRRGHRNLTAEQVVALGDGAWHVNLRASAEVRHHAQRQALAEFGFDQVDYFRARYWLRRGKPAGYVWHA